jgi:uncharacterized protein
MSTLVFLAILWLAVIGSAAQSATGFGLALLVAPIFVAFLAPESAVLGIAIVSLIHNLLVVGSRHKRLLIRRKQFILIIAAAAPGLLLGSLIVTQLSKPVMQLTVGFTILTAVALRTHVPNRFPILQTTGAGATAALLCGTLTTTVGVNSPPLVIWLRARKHSMTQLRDTLCLVFLTLNIATIPSLLSIGGEVSLPAVSATVIGLILGHPIGMFANKYLNQQLLQKTVTALLLLAGFITITAGVIG